MKFQMNYRVYVSDQNSEVVKYYLTGKPMYHEAVYERNAVALVGVLENVLKEYVLQDLNSYNNCSVVLERLYSA